MPLDTMADALAPIAPSAVHGASRTQDCGSHSGPRWYCVQSKPSAEVQASQELRNQRFETFLPQEEVLLKQRLRRVPGLRPLFRGYLFVRFDAKQDQWRPIISTRGVLRLFSTTPEHPLPVRPGVVEALIEAGVHIERPADVLIKAGATVRIISGPLAGFHADALVIQRERVTIQVELFGRPSRMTMPVANLVPVDAATASYAHTA